MVSYQTPPNLLALRHVEAGMQMPLPSNQWQIEVQDWHGTVLSGIQQYLIEHATGPQDHSWAKFFKTSNTTAERALCHAQRVRVNGGYANVNVFGMALILAFGGVTIIASLSCRHLGVWLQKRRTEGSSGRNVAWIQDEMFQLHRVACQARGLGHWKGEGDLVPVTENGELFKSHWAVDVREEENGSAPA